MDKMTKMAGFFRSNPVHLRKSGGESDFFRSISVHLPQEIRMNAAFPEHTRSLVALSQVKSGVPTPFFRSISVHF